MMSRHFRNRSAFGLVEAMVAGTLFLGLLVIVWRAFLTGNRQTVGASKFADFMQAETVIRSRLQSDLDCLVTVPARPDAEIEPESLSFQRMDFSTDPSKPFQVEKVTYTAVRRSDGTYGLTRNGTTLLDAGLARPPFAKIDSPGISILLGDFVMKGIRGTGSNAGHSFRVARVLAKPPPPGPPPPGTPPPPRRS
jgi:hypothetical protein